MSVGNNEVNIISLSKAERKKFIKFTDTFKKTDNFYSFNYIGGKEKGKSEKKNFDNEDFYGKYEELSNSSGPEVFELEKELAKYVKLWHSTGKEYIVESKIYQDDFFNEENVLSNILGDQYIKKNYSIIPFQLIEYIISELEKKVFDIELLQNIRDQNVLLDAPIADKGFIEFLLNNDIEEKLHNLYQGEKVTQGYSYVIEKIVVFDLFLIYIVLKNYPFYVLRRDRLEILFKSLKKYKSFPYPIGSIGMDLFKLLINELYLPGVTIFQEVRQTLLLDILDPNIIDVNPSDFIKVVTFEPGIANIKKKNKEDNNINLIDSNNNQTTTNFKLHELKELTFICLLVFAAYILYSSEDKKDSEKEEIYFENILALFEKRLKQKKEEVKNKENNPNIYEKNIVNDIFNLIDEGLDSDYNKFKKEVKAVNDKLISKSKESHETTTSKPRDNINLRRFLFHNVHYIKMSYEMKKKFKPVIKSNKIKDNNSQKASMGKRNMPNMKKGDKGKQGFINGEEGLEDEQTEDKESLEKIENIRLISEYKEQLNAEKDVDNDNVLMDYIDNFTKLKKKYFRHLQEFQVDNFIFSEDKEKDAFERKKILDFNIFSKIKEKQLTELYKQKYIVKENQLIYFLKNLDVWKCNIRPLYHKKLRKEYNEKKEAEIENAKKIEKKDSDSLNNDNLININILEVNLRDISAAIRNALLSEEKDKIAYIVNSDLPFNYELFLIPGEAKKVKGDDKRPDNPLTKFISKQDFIYKSIIGDFYWTLFNGENIDNECHSFIDTPLQLYLKEAQHFYNLKVFQCKIKTLSPNQNEIDELNISGDYYYIYGSIHIESETGILLQLDKEKIAFTNDDANKKTIYIDIINIYNENEGNKINDIEKYLVNPNSNCFQVFVSAEKNGKNAKIDSTEKKEEYLKKFVVPILNFDVKSLNYEAKKIIVSPIDDGNFKLTPTFLNINPTEVTYFEIDYEPNKNLNRDKKNEKEENPDLGVYSFDIKIKTFIDLYKSDD